MINYFQTEQNDIRTLFACNDSVNSLYVNVLQIVKRYNYPDTAAVELLQATQELNRQLFLIANYIAGNSQNYTEDIDELLKRAAAVEK